MHLCQREQNIVLELFSHQDQRGNDRQCCIRLSNGLSRVHSSYCACANEKNCVWQPCWGGRTQWLNKSSKRTGAGVCNSLSRLKFVTLNAQVLLNSTFSNTGGRAFSTWFIPGLSFLWSLLKGEQEILTHNWCTRGSHKTVKSKLRKQPEKVTYLLSK